MAKALTEKEWDQLIREMFKNLARNVLPERGDNPKAAKALGLSISAIEQMKSSGKGSPKSWVRLMAHGANLGPEEIHSFFTNFPGLLKDIKPLSEVDQLFEKLKASYDSQEIAALLQLLLAKKEVEDFLGLKIKVSRTGRKPKGPKKKA